jgi:predicted TIM-barrel fold metal-dependent hydrolase
MGPMQPRIFGGYEAIRRDYPISEYLADIAATGVEKAVYVQANWPNEKAVEEVAWIERLALETGWPHASIAYADMMVEDIRPFLDRLMRHPRVRGIRQQFHWHRNPQYRFAMHAELCRDTLVQRNMVRLADYALTFDLQVFAGQMAGAAELAQACPRVIFVLQHAGMLEDLSSRGREEWQKGMAALAACPNVMVKLSGLGTFLHRVDAAHIAWVYAETLARFGHARCLWGSNFPIEKLWTDYAPLLAAHRNAMRDLDEAAMRTLLFDNASRVYRL